MLELTKVQKNNLKWASGVLALSFVLLGGAGGFLSLITLCFAVLFVWLILDERKAYKNINMYYLFIGIGVVLGIMANAWLSYHLIPQEEVTFFMVVGMSCVFCLNIAIITVMSVICGDLLGRIIHLMES